MLGRADDQVFKISEGVFTKHIAFIARDIPANGGLSRKDIEMVLPKIHHHFLQLPFGIHRPKDAIRDNLRDDLSGRLKVVFLIQGLNFFAALTLLGLCHGVWVLRGSIGSHLSVFLSLRICLSGPTAFELAKQGTRIRIFRKKLGCRHSKNIEILDLGFGDGIFYRRRI